MRTRQRTALGTLLDAARTGGSAALVVRGEQGIDQRAVLDQVAGTASGFRVARVAGSESATTVGYAGLHQLCAQLLDHCEWLPAAQRDALRTAFDPSAPGPGPGPAGLALFSLLTHAAEERPLLCVLQNPQWLDSPSRQALAFTARRLAAESVVLLFVLPGAERPPEFAGLPETVRTTEATEEALS
jgi:hypothetical protein